MRSLALALALALAGCTASEPLGGLARDDPPPEPYFKDYREPVAPRTERTKLVAIDEGATRLNVTILLTQRDNGLPLPEASPARVTLSVVEPAGSVVQSVVADPASPSGSVLVVEPRAGAWSIQVSGTGPSGMFEDAAFAAEYVLTVEVLYE